MSYYEDELEHKETSRSDDSNLSQPSAGKESTNLDDYINGKSDNDDLYSAEGDDHLSGNEGDDHLDGGTGLDTSSYRGGLKEYTITKDSNGSIHIEDHIVGRDGNDTLNNVERIQFSDSSIALDISGNAGQAYRLYQAAFDRKPDNGGLKYWIGKVDAGVDLETVAAAFQVSAEFQAKYGTNPTADQLITAMYSNVLHRAPDAEGNDYWKAQLSSGTVTKDSLLVNFSESNENQLNVIGVIQNGIELT